MSVVYPELVIGIVGRIGTDTVCTTKWLKEELHTLYYSSKVIKLTNYLKEIDVGIELKEHPVEDRYSTYIAACNKVRELAGRKDYFASVAISGISSIRDSNESRRTAYIIDQIKRPEEAVALRKVYGEQFILVSCHTPLERRILQLASRLAGEHAGSPKIEMWKSEAKKLIDQDNSEASQDFGQRVGKVFHQADLIIDSSQENSSRVVITRFFEALFGKPTISPTKKEYFQNIAMNVALTSCDTARQVGAAIERQGEIVSTGFNEAPKAGGGTYWAEDGYDARDVALGKDPNTIRKRQMVTEIIQILRDRKELADNTITNSEIEGKYLDNGDAPLQDSQIMDSLEYGRAVHAEMAALSTASRNGISVRDGILHCTTFPCHNCAKHIVASGIKRVVFIEPFPKSFADYLYPDSISIDPSTDSSEKVIFEQFVGITPVRYGKLFKKKTSKDGRGYVLPWEPETSTPNIEAKFQEQFAREVAFQKMIEETIIEYSKENAVTLGILDPAT